MMTAFSVLLLIGLQHDTKNKSQMSRHMSSIEMQQMGSTERLLWEGKAFLYGARQLEKGVSLFLHGNVSDLDRLKGVMKNWPGKVSLCLYVHINHLQEHNLEKIQTYRNEHKPRLIITLYSAQDTYPINILRNRAVQRVTTELALSSDLYTLPNLGLYDYLTANYDHLVKMSNTMVYALPIFYMNEEEGDDFKMLASKEELLEGIRNKKIVDKLGMNETDWFEAMEKYKVQNWNEPYLIVSLRYVPLFDERVLYRSDPLQWNYHLAVLGYEYTLLPHHFLIQNSL